MWPSSRSGHRYRCYFWPSSRSGHRYRCYFWPSSRSGHRYRCYFWPSSRSGHRYRCYFWPSSRSGHRYRCYFWPSSRSGHRYRCYFWCILLICVSPPGDSEVCVWKPAVFRALYPRSGQQKVANGGGNRWLYCTTTWMGRRSGVPWAH